MREHFNKEMDELNQEILKMGTLVQESLRKAIEALEDKDSASAKKIIADDERINVLQQEIEDRCAALIAREQPVASDLRRIITVLKIVSNLERIGDHSVHMAKTTIRIANQNSLDPIIHMLPSMAEIGISMVGDALTALLNSDTEKAREISKRDDQIDDFRNRLFHEVIVYMKNNPDIIPQATDLLFIIRFLERLGDHVTNICEWIVFSNTGKHEELNR
ncbi:MAG: phosphate transport system regulatory protein PhoU [Spirochaetes bacterium]|nr:MAG: phosphate transport system regulatory protein PhoU [Spirochaetota bacterium]